MFECDIICMRMSWRAGSKEYLITSSSRSAWSVAGMLKIRVLEVFEVDQYNIHIVYECKSGPTTRTRDPKGHCSAWKLDLFPREQKFTKELFPGIASDSKTTPLPPLRLFEARWDLDSCRAPPKNADSHAKIKRDRRHSDDL